MKTGTKANKYIFFELNNFNKRLVSYYLIPLAILFIISVFYSYFEFMPSNVDSAQYLISALIQSEAAILAIVITLSIVAVQQSSSAYSPRIIKIFMDKNKNPDFWILIGLYTIAMIYGSIVLKLLKGDLNQLSNLQTHIWFTYSLSILAFTSLRPFISNTLDLLRPSTIIEVLSENITMENILIAIDEQENKNKYPEALHEWCIEDLQELRSCNENNDPILSIIDIVRGALINYDYETARIGLESIEKRTINIYQKEIFNDRELDKLLNNLIVHFTKVASLSSSSSWYFVSPDIIRAPIG